MKYCYMTLLTSDSYVPGVILLNQSLRKVESKYPLVCLITDDLSEESLAILKAQNIVTDKVTNIGAPERIYNHNKKLGATWADVWKDTFTKFHIWRYTQFEKIIFLDADLLILKNLDHCFEYEDMTGAVDGEYFDLWPNNVHLNSGFFILKPSTDTYMGLVRFIYSLYPDKMPDYLGNQRIIADQDVIDEYFYDWGKEKQLSKYYNIFAPYITKGQEKDIIDNGFFIHFVGCKPWNFTDKVPNFWKDPGLDYKSKLFYEIAQGIISYVYKHNYRNIDWSKETVEVIDEIIDFTLGLGDKESVEKICKYLNYKDVLRQLNELDDKEERKKILKELFVYLYKHPLVSNAYVFELINCLDCDKDDMVNYLWGLITKPIVDRYGKY